jgi:hypothetical protein
MDRSESWKARNRWWNPRYWLVCLVGGLICLFVSVMTQPLWGKSDPTLIFGIIFIIITGLIGPVRIERWIDDYFSNRPNKS